MRRFPSLALMLLALCPAVASAQTDVTETTPSAPTSPRARVDVVNAVGWGAATGAPGLAYSASVGVSVVDRSGHGLRVQVSGLETDVLGSGLFGPHPAWVDELLLDASYAYRFRLTGDDRSGLGLDLYGGMTAATVHFHQGTSGLCFGGDCSVPDVPESVADGWHLGATAGASLDFRAHGFVIGFDVQGHALVALERDEVTEQTFQGDVSGGIHIGVGFY